jgi:alpha-ribazole phosphatase/probable phosphoglycerate mutase
MIEIWFEPHGTTPDNEAKIASGWNDVDLSELGRQQASEMVERNKERGIDAIFCSDLQRAVKTAIPTADALHIPVYPDKRLRECDYGEFEHKSSSLIETERLKRIDTAFPGGESYSQCMERMKPFFERLKNDFDGKTVLIIGHRATHYGVEVFSQGRQLEDCINEKWQWQPGWKYELR